MKIDNRPLKEIVESLKADGMRCNCDLDKWQPEPTTGHSHVCDIHKYTMVIKYDVKEIMVRG